jgi:NAD(P)-dependent dehydrogenase (short-subunit alcohol dehydrogenase family)
VDLQLAGKRAIITGASRGIGYAVASALVAEGVEVTMVARGNEALAEAAERPRRAPGWPPGVTIGRLIDASEVADVVAFLCSPRSVAINGDAIAVGGVRGPIFY